MAERDTAAYLTELGLLTGRGNAAFASLIYEWLNDLFELVETDPEKLWFLDKTVQFTIGVSDIGAAGAAIVDMPEDLEHAYSIFLVDTTTLNAYTEVLPIADHEAKKKYGPVDSGPPERYSEEGQSFRFWPPAPDTTYTAELSYKSKLTRIGATADRNDFMLNYHGLVVQGLQAKAWEYLRQFDVADRWWAKWNAGWADLRASNVARIMNGEQTLAPRTDVNAGVDTERGGNKLVWGGN